MPERSLLVRPWSELTTRELYFILKLRTDVFLVEQNVDETELDGRDLEPTTQHVWIEDEHGVAAYLRVLADAVPEHRDAHTVVGRVVVRADRRGEGLARDLLLEVIQRHGARPMMLHAQVAVRGVYERFGFEAFGEQYDEAGIPHISMYRPADSV